MHAAGRSSGTAATRFSPIRGERPGAVYASLDAAVAAGAWLAVAAMTAIYAALKRLPVRDKVVLMSRLYEHTSPEFGCLRAEVERQSPGTEVVVLNHRNVAPLAVPVQMLVEMYHLATARACVTDSYMAPISALRHRDGLVVVQVWHALGAIKRFGLAAVGTAEGRPGRLSTVMRMHRGYDWVIAGSMPMVEPFADAFGVPLERVLPLGTPRIDLLLDAAGVAGRQRRIRAAHPRLGTRPVVLYAPTFRTAEPVRVAGLLDELARADVDVVLCLHPLDHRDFSARTGVTQDPAFSTLDWLTVADALVTDYSAVVFDAAVLGVPSYFYAYDLDDYRARRGFVLDYDHDLPGPVFGEPAPLVDAIGRHAVDRAAIAHFRDRFVAATDGGCTRRIVQLVLGATPGELA